MHELKELRDMLNKELIKASQRGINTSNLEMIDKLSHSIKSIDTIIAMEDSGYSNTGYGRGNGYSYARRDSMGRYSRDMMRDDYSRDTYGYSRADGMEQLRDMMNNTSDSKLRRAIEKAMDAMQD